MNLPRAIAFTTACILRYMAKVFRQWPFSRLVFRQPSVTSLTFPTTGFDIIADKYILEEEQFDEFEKGKYYPVNIGEVFASRYQVVGKLGFGVTSTVWLARDLSTHDYVSLKVYTRDVVDKDEFNISQILNKGDSSHPGFKHVRTALDIFTIPRAGGNHKCLVQKPMWDSFKDLLRRNPARRFTEELLRAGLPQIFLALEYLHCECKLVHTDIKADNIFIEIADKSILDSFVKAELEDPSPRKFVNNAPIYLSRSFDYPKAIGKAVLGDFGSAVYGDRKRTHDAQPNVYRCPEVMLETEWSYPADIWNVGVMIWDLFEGKHMFYGNDPLEKRYLTRAHLAEVVAMLGLPPLDLLNRGSRSKEFFTDDGQWKANIPIPQDLSLKGSEERFEGEEKEEFLQFMRGMLQWKPEDRKTAWQLLHDPWLKGISSYFL
ncbi:MAG: hypothetical protein M1822_002833 [Bathelium mastoideum]|nr:MAG: hypothetical protein M1822_002833 [Bathelium mastoideum]